MNDIVFVFERTVRLYRMIPLHIIPVNSFNKIQYTQINKNVCVTSFVKSKYESSYIYRT